MTPTRMCVVCREIKDRNLLLRIAKTPDGILPDPEGKLEGRGAYICKTKACISLARKKKVFERSFSCKIEDALYTSLEGLVD